MYEVQPYIRHCDGSSGILVDGLQITYEGSPNAWRSALKKMYAMGFVEVEEAKAAGWVPLDWQVAPEVQDRHPYTEVKVLFQQALNHNQRCLRLAQAAPFCPHCGDSEKIRFIDRLPDMASLHQQEFVSLQTSYFICNACARSFGHDYLDSIKTSG